MRLLIELPTTSTLTFNDTKMRTTDDTEKTNDVIQHLKIDLLMKIDLLITGICREIQTKLWIVDRRRRTKIYGFGYFVIEIFNVDFILNNSLD